MKKETKPLLHDHKKIGKKFIPPLMQLPMNTSVSYVNGMLPELIWLGLLNDFFGYSHSARIMEGVFLSAHTITKSKPIGNFAFISNFNFLSIEQKDQLVEKLREENTLALLQEHIAPLTVLYENCPLAFIGSPVREHSKDQLISKIENCVKRSFSKFDKPGIILNGTVLLYQLVTRTIKFSSEIKLPDFNSVINSPETDEAKRASGLMRTIALTQFGAENIDATWARHFWNRNAKLSPCQFFEEEVRDE